MNRITCEECGSPWVVEGEPCPTCSYVETDETDEDESLSGEATITEERVRLIVRQELDASGTADMHRLVGRGCAWAVVIVALALFVSACANYWSIVH